MNFTDFDGCGCPGGHPPCSYCTDSFECESCGHRHYSDYAVEHKKYGFICDDCQDFYGPKGFWFWFMLVLVTGFFVIFPMLWVCIYITYGDYKERKAKKMLLPPFYIFFYEWVFTETVYYKKA